MIKIKLKWKWVILASLIFGLFTAIALPQTNSYLNKMTGVSTSPDTSLIYSAEDLYDIASVYGESGRKGYIKTRWTFDVVWPILYTLVLILWTIKLSENTFVDKHLKYLFVLPLSGMMLDFLENIGATIIMSRYPLRSGVIANITPIMTFLKWITLFASIIMVLILAVKYIFDKKSI